jgi:cytidine deaminase
LIEQRSALWLGKHRIRNLEGILPGVGSKARSLLLHILNQSDFDGTLSAEDATAIVGIPPHRAKTCASGTPEGKSITNLMVELLPLAGSFARPSISNFPVGAIIRGASGRLYFGANVEFAGESLGATVHAEQSAASNAFMHRESDITELAVTAAPCGLCRQFLWEMCYNSDLQVLTNTHSPVALTSLLPDAFGPGDLGLQRGALPVVDKQLRLSEANADEVALAALEAAQMSYAPYTKAYAGVGIRTSQGRIYRGSYIENAAYNPSLPAFRGAFAALTVAGGDPADIVEACLVEIAGKPVRHGEVAKAALSVIAPSAAFHGLFADEQG